MSRAPASDGKQDRAFLLSTGLKMFLILTLALLPLGLLALFASLQSIRSADIEKQALLQVAAGQSARKLAGELASDRAALTLSVNTLARERGDAELCARLKSFLQARNASDTQLVIYDRDGRQYCPGLFGDTANVTADQRFLPRDYQILPGPKNLITRTFSDDGRLVAIAHYTVTWLHNVAAPPVSSENSRIVLREGNDRIEISTSRQLATNKAATRVSAAVAGTSLTLVTEAFSPPVTLMRALS